MKGSTMLKLWALVLLALTMSGCEGRLLVFGNMLFMGVACAMLWSTVNLNKRD